MIRLFKVLIPASVIALLLTEIALLFGSYVAVAYAVMDLDPEIFLIYDNGLVRIGGNVLVVVAGLYLNNLYSTVKIRSRTRLVQQICMVFGIAFLAQAVLAYLNPDWVLPRWMMIGGSALALVGVVLWRMLFSLTGVWTLGSQRVLFVGSDPIIFEIAQSLKSRPELGLHADGYLAAEDEPPRALESLRRLGTPEQLGDIAAELKPQRISFAPGKHIASIRPEDLIEVQFAGINTEKATDTYEAVFSRVCTRWIQPPDLILTNDYCPRPLRVKFQTSYAFLVALAAAVVLLPLMAIIAAAIKLNSPGPALSKIRCPGLAGGVFNLLQFRTIRSGTGAPSLPSPATESDPRLTSLGRHLRRSRLDRLPALLNVLRGDMSIVGPRPEQEAFGRVLAENIPFYVQRYSVKPGITGWAQINSRPVGEMEDTLVRIEYDLYYVKNLSSALDLYIASYTLKTLLLSHGEY
jgi:lipopolysaccharide/colanic/teichoic acid biosynthesis glycosyltransferase